MSTKKKVKLEKAEVKKVTKAEEKKSVEKVVDAVKGKTEKSSTKSVVNVVRGKVNSAPPEKSVAIKPVSGYMTADGTFFQSVKKAVAHYEVMTITDLLVPALAEKISTVIPPVEFNDIVCSLLGEAIPETPVGAVVSPVKSVVEDEHEEVANAAIAEESAVVDSGSIVVGEEIALQIWRDALSSLSKKATEVVIENRSLIKQIIDFSISFQEASDTE